MLIQGQLISERTGPSSGQATQRTLKLYQLIKPIRSAKVGAGKEGRGRVLPKQASQSGYQLKMERINDILNQPITIKVNNKFHKDPIQALQNSLIFSKQFDAPSPIQPQSLIPHLQPHPKSSPTIPQANQYISIKYQQHTLSKRLPMPAMKPRRFINQQVYDLYTEGEDSQCTYVQFNSRQQLNMALQKEALNAFIKISGRAPSTKQMECVMLDIDVQMGLTDDLDIDGIVERAIGII